MIASDPAGSATPVTGGRGPGSPSLAIGRLALKLLSIGLRLALLVAAAVVMQIGWIGVWTLSYRLTHGNDYTFTYLMTRPAVWDKLMDLLLLANTLAPGLEMQGFQGPVSLDIVVNSLVMAFVLTGVGYLAAILLIDSGVSAVRGAVLVVLACALVFQVTLFLTPGLFTTDIFSYVMYGHISADYNLNPYIYPPNYFPGNPLLNWIHPIWHDQPSVYGPLWTDLGWVMATLTAPLGGLVTTLGDGTTLNVGLMYQVFAYKLMMNVVQIVNLALVWWLLGRSFGDRPRARLTAFVVFAWNPMMLFDGPGNAHNDALMVTLLLLGVVPLVWHRRGEQISNAAWSLGTLCVGLSALIKYTTGLVGLFYIVPWGRRLPGWKARVLWIGGTGLVIGVLSVALFVPWLDPRAMDPMLVALSGKAWMYTNWAPDLAALTFDRVLDPSTADDPSALHEGVRSAAKVITRVIFAIYLGWELVRLWRIAGDRERAILEPILAASARAFAVLILLVLTWVLEWYWMWPLALVTLLGWRRMLTKVVVAYTLTSLPVFYVHHYWSSNMPGVLVLAYALPPLALPLIDWVWRRWKLRGAEVASVAPPVMRVGAGAASE
jgi:alpha-1,6-mannosyltransferase